MNDAMSQNSQANEHESKHVTLEVRNVLRNDYAEEQVTVVAD
jgi:hypothetical protein